MADTVITAAGFLLFRDSDEGRLWLLLQNRKRGDWGFPKGHAEPGEDLLTTARRECREETGIKEVTLLAGCESLSYETDRGLKTVTYFPARCASGKVRLSKEHSAHAWLDEAAAAAQLQHSSLRALFLLVAERLRC